MFPDKQRIRCPLCGRRVNPMNHDCEELILLEEMDPPEPTSSDPEEAIDPAQATDEDILPPEEKRGY